MNKNKIIRFRVTPSELHSIQQAAGTQSANEFTRKIVLDRARIKRTEYSIKREKYNERLIDLNVKICDMQTEHKIVEKLLLENADEEEKHIEKQKVKTNE